MGVYWYLVTVTIFHPNRLNKAVLLINTENRIIELSKYRMVISTIVTRVLECSRVITEELLSKSGTKSKVWDYFSLQKGADGKPLDNRELFVELAVHV